MPELIKDPSCNMKILLITLSNIGDVILTLPVVSAISKKFPEGQLDILVGPRAQEIFQEDPRINKVFIYNTGSLKEKLNLAFSLRKNNYDLVVDLRNSIFGPVLKPGSLFLALKKPPRDRIHMKDRHLWRLEQIVPYIEDNTLGSNIYINNSVISEVDNMLLAHNISTNDIIISISPGAKSHTKRWIADGFADVSGRLLDELGTKVILIGAEEDREIVNAVLAKLKKSAIDLCGKTNIKQLTALLKRSSLLISNDSAPMHLAWAVGTPVVAIFGPTDSEKYKPTGPKDVVIKKDLDCLPCEKALCASNSECMKLIDPDEVFQAAKKILSRE